MIFNFIFHLTANATSIWICNPVSLQRRHDHPRSFYEILKVCAFPIPSLAIAPRISEQRAAVLLTDVFGQGPI